MLSDEEKKAVEGLKVEIDSLKVSIAGFERDIEDKSWCNKVTGELNHDILIRETILNLIEKQSKEIEELKEKNKYLPNWVSKKYVSKDKIKSKIEELDIEIQCCEYADDDSEEYKQDIEKEKARLLRDKAILQSLLEKKEV